jgi:hypothetical protein
MVEFENPIWSQKRDCCSKCGRKEFYENKIASKVERTLMCQCKGCGDIHKWLSRISIDEWRIKMIEKISNEHR